MNIDIRLSLGFMAHPKTKRLKKTLGADGVLSLLSLWIWAAENRPSGVLANLESEDIEAAADWEGEAGAFTDALLKLHWLDFDDDENYVLHNWEERQAYASQSDARRDRAKKAAAARWSNANDANSNAEAMLNDANSNANDANSNAPRYQDTKIPRYQDTKIPSTKKERVATADAVAPSLGSEYIDFVKDFQESVAREQGNTAPKITDALIREGAATLDKVIRIDGFDFDEVKQALAWSKTNTFWSSNVLSIAQLRKKSKSNGFTKIQNLVRQYRASLIQKIPQQPQYESRYEREQREKRESYAETMRILNMMDGKSDGQERADLIDASAF